MDSIVKEYAKAWISAMRLRTLPLSISGIIIGACLAHYNGFFKWNIFLLALCTAISLQILSNLANDYGDGLKGTDNKDRVGPERAIQSGIISPSQMYNGIKFNIVVVIFFAFILILKAFGLNNFVYSFIFFAIGGLSIIAAIRYTVGESAYGYKGLGDLFVFIFFGFVSVLGSYFLFAKQIDHVLFLPAICIGFLSMAVLNLNNMRDIESDRKANKITLAVKLGFHRAKTYHNFLVISTIVLSIIFVVLYYNSPFNFIFVISFIPLISHLVIINKNKQPELLDPQLKILAISAFLFSILLGIGQLL